MQLTNNVPSKTEMDESKLSLLDLLNNELNNNFNSTIYPLSPSNSKMSVSICPLYEHENENDSLSHLSHHQQSHITSITSDRTDENLILVDDYNQHSMTDSIMSSDTETHNLSYTPHNIIYHDELSPVSESISESEEYVTTLFEINNHSLKCKKKNLSDIIVTHTKGQIHDRCAKQSVEIDDRLTQIITSMNSMTSNPEIVRLQQQLSNLSEKIKQTQEFTRQIQLLHHSPPLSNKTQRLTYSNMSQSLISSKDSNDDSIIDNNNDNIATLINVPSTPFTPITPMTPITQFTPTNSHINNYWIPNEVIFPDVDKINENTIINENIIYENKINENIIIKEDKNNKKRKRKKKNTNKTISCNSVAEMKLKRKKKKKKKQQNRMCIWPSFKCFDLRVCMKSKNINMNGKKSEKR